MRSRLPTIRQVLRIIVIGIFLVALVVFIRLGYVREWQWTGFPAKKLFDWMQILVIPVAVAIGTFVLNRAAKRRDDAAQEESRTREEAAQQAQKEREEAIETRHAEEASLQAYLDYISRLLTDPDRPLHRSQLGDHLSVVARAQTLTSLGRLDDGERKAVVLRFLYEAGLIARKRPVILLQGADLRGAVLKDAYLGGAGFVGAKLYRADLRGAILRGAILRGGANPRKRALLRGANLQGADLQGAEVKQKQLDTARSLQGAIMPNGERHA